MQNRILKYVNKNTFDIDKMPCNLRQLFSLESLLYHYESLQNSFLNSKNKTRNETIQLPFNDKTVCNKMSSVEATKTFNSLPNELKIILKNKKQIKQILKEWILRNV